MGRGVRTAVAAGMLLLAAGCTASEPRPASSPGTIPNERVSTDNALPEEFPSDFPLPAPHTVIYSAVSPVGVVVYFTSTSSQQAVKDSLLTGLVRGDWKLHSCIKATGGVSPLTTIVASKGKAVATAVAGYSPDYASRLKGRIYSFFVSVATDADAPLTTAKPC